MRAPSAKLRTCFDKLRLSGVGLALMLLAGCQKSFDERYADAEKKVREQAESIDQELAAKASEAAMGEGGASSSPSRGGITPLPASSPGAPPRRIPPP